MKVLHPHSNVLGILKHLHVSQLILAQEVQQARWKILLWKGEGVSEDESEGMGHCSNE